MFRFTRSRPVLGAVVIAVAACSSEPVTVPTTRSFSPVVETSRDVTPIAGRHVFVMKNGVPADFAARVAAKGGTVLSDFAELSTVVTSGLSDADAAILSAGGAVTNDFTARWVETPEEMGAAVATAGSAPAAEAQAATPPMFFPIQWNLFQIHAPEAWAAGKVGDGKTRVGILDSGIDPDHVDLSGRVDEKVSARVVFDTKTGFCLFSQARAAWTDDFFHGTYVFTGIYSGYDFSDFLLGVPQQASV